MARFPILDKVIIVMDQGDKHSSTSRKLFSSVWKQTTDTCTGKVHYFRPTLYQTCMYSQWFTFLNSLILREAISTDIELNPKVTTHMNNQHFTWIESQHSSVAYDKRRLVSSYRRSRMGLMWRLRIVRQCRKAHQQLCLRSYINSSSVV